MIQNLYRDLHRDLPRDLPRVYTRDFYRHLLKRLTLKRSRHPMINKLSEVYQLNPLNDDRVAYQSTDQSIDQVAGECYSLSRSR